MNAAVIAVLLTVAGAHPTFEVEVIGKGRPVVLIPGLSSSSEVWKPTAEALKGQYQLHLVSLAGFGGVKPVQGPLLQRLRDELVRYVSELNRPILVGHSLGGTLALWVAAVAPDKVAGVVAVDGVPFLPALQNPAATEASMTPFAASIKERYAAMTPQQFAGANAASLGQMVTSPEDLEGLIRMCNASDPGTVGAAVAELMSTDLRDEMARVKAPILVLGAGSWATTPELEKVAMAGYQAQVAKAPAAKVVLIPRARHFLMYDAKGAVLKALTAFLGATK